jgi:hypothetical protein
VEYNGKVHQLVIDFKISYDSVRKFSTLTIPAGPITTYLYERRREICKGIELFDAFLIHNHLNQGDALPTLLFNFPLEYTQHRT